MNRTALCIRMLQLLKVRGRMRIDEIAQALEINPRNVREFRKELETAGYSILQTTGRYGGYQLDAAALLPAAALDAQEEDALQEGCRYLRSHADFIAADAFERAMGKILSAHSAPKKSPSIYLQERMPGISAMEQRYVDRCVEAIRDQRSVILTYRTLSAAKPYTIEIHPYELLFFQGACYCLAYSMKAHDFRSFRFSEQRMFDFRLTQRRFDRDPNFAVDRYVGRTGLIRGDFIHARFEVRHEQARRVAERSVGISSKMRWIDADTLEVDAWIETEYELFDLLLRLGADARLLEPADLVQRMKAQITAMLRRYEEEELNDPSE